MNNSILSTCKVSTAVLNSHLGNKHVEGTVLLENVQCQNKT